MIFEIILNYKNNKYAILHYYNPLNNNRFIHKISCKHISTKQDKYFVRFYLFTIFWKYLNCIFYTNTKFYLKNMNYYFDFFNFLLLF